MGNFLCFYEGCLLHHPFFLSTPPLSTNKLLVENYYFHTFFNSLFPKGHIPFFFLGTTFFLSLKIDLKKITFEVTVLSTPEFCNFSIRIMSKRLNISKLTYVIDLTNTVHPSKYIKVGKITA